uniref:Uncharacterized protein n=1 Tax=Rhipicephalus zambeziensis TaxID=60191 RepID=A0A224YJG3_9ACAR
MSLPSLRVGPYKENEIGKPATTLGSLITTSRDNGCRLSGHVCGSMRTFLQCPVKRDGDAHSLFLRAPLQHEIAGISVDITDIRQNLGTHSVFIRFLNVLLWLACFVASHLTDRCRPASHLNKNEMCTRFVLCLECLAVLARIIWRCCCGTSFF